MTYGLLLKEYDHDRQEFSLRFVPATISGNRSHIVDHCKSWLWDQLDSGYRLQINGNEAVIVSKNPNIPSVGGGQDREIMCMAYRYAGSDADEWITIPVKEWLTR